MFQGRVVYGAEVVIVKKVNIIAMAKTEINYFRTRRCSLHDWISIVQSQEEEISRSIVGFISVQNYSIVFFRFEGNRDIEVKIVVDHWGQFDETVDFFAEIGNDSCYHHHHWNLYVFFLVACQAYVRSCVMFRHVDQT